LRFEDIEVKVEKVIVCINLEMSRVEVLKKGFSLLFFSCNELLFENLGTVFLFVLQFLLGIFNFSESLERNQKP